MYAVNTGATRTVAEIDFGKGHVDAVSGASCHGVTWLALEPYELRTYSDR